MADSLKFERGAAKALPYTVQTVSSSLASHKNRLRKERGLLFALVPLWRKTWNGDPLKSVLLIAVTLRVLAAVFSKGYAFHDEHFDVIRVAQNWLDGIPNWIADPVPPNHSMFYAGINAAFLYISEAIGITDPQSKMLAVRLVHAFYSVLIVYYGFKITERLSNTANATLVGLMLATLWFMPFLSVQNLVEMVCMPPLLAAFYRIVKKEVSNMDWLIAGGLIGLAFTFRLHVVIFAGGVGIIMLYRKQFLQAVVFSAGFLTVAFSVTGVIDWFFWEYPFQSIVSYFVFNTSHAYDFSTGPVYRFFLTVMGFTVPPISLLLLYGYIKSWKVSNEMWLAATLFFVIHSIFPNKQERFILPFFPFFISLGIICWNEFLVRSSYWPKHRRLLKGIWMFFWCVNILTAIALSLSYSKKDRIAPLSYLSTKSDLEALVIESSSNIKPVPEYYLGGIAGLNDDEVRSLNKAHGLNKEEIKVIYRKPNTKTVNTLKSEIEQNGKIPNYVIFKKSDHLEERKRELISIFTNKKLVKIQEIAPSAMDQVQHFFNPRVHKNRKSYIYKIVPVN
ncbi:glycosyltransferase family 39 protein [Pontibacter pamirensis]|uniref:glycosyltransferase family 39 protein n=1 Tax=Pontibacter pamirensis TaxID=2562824 RepID=UPI001389D8FF|nr:glycosyltransferase family 39 protein [Pontibacter pamirensis]